MTDGRSAAFRRWRSDERGAVAALVAVSLVAVLGFGALVIDLANVFLAESIVQVPHNDETNWIEIPS